MKPTSRLLAALLAVASVVGINGGIGAAQVPPAPLEVSVSEHAQRQLVPVRQQPPERHATIISDSAMAGIRWNGALDGFRGFNADARLQSCRRLVTESCSGREGFRPPTALNEIRYLPLAGPTDVLVIAVGYNDSHFGFGWQSRAILDAARTRGFQTVAWVTYRESLGYELPEDSDVDRSNYAYMNAALRGLVASGDYPELQLWDLDGFTRGVAGWFAADGVHELRRGSWGVADWVSRHMAALDGRPCPMPWTPTAAPDEVCTNPDPLAYVRGWPDIAGLYGV